MSSPKQTRYLTDTIFVISNKMADHWTPSLQRQDCGYPDEMQNEIMRDTLVFGTDHEVVRKKCITKGNGLTFEKARDIARTEEATQAQLRAMDAPVPLT